MTASTLCRQNHFAPNIGVFCVDTCPEFTLMTAGPPPQRLRVGWPIALLILSELGALILFRQSGSIWAMYEFLVLNLLNLYVVVFSRGSALLVAALVTLAAVAGWAILQLLHTWLPGGLLHGSLP